MGKSERRKGRTYENEVARLMDATRISEAGSPGPDLLWRSRYIECKRRRDTYQSLNQIQKYLDDDTSIYVTRLDRGRDIAVLHLDTLLDLLDEAEGWDQ